MKNNWIITSIGAGILGGFLSHLIVKDWKVNLIVAVIVTAGMLMNNPQKRYIRVFWVLLSMFFVLNKLFFKIVGSILEVNFEFGSNEIHWIVSIALLLLAGSSLRLDYLERNGISRNLGKCFSLRINTDNTKGDKIYQGANSIFKKIIIHVDCIESGDKMIRIDQLDEFEKLINREEELLSLIKHLPSDKHQKAEKYQTELTELREETYNLRERLTEIVNKINALGIINPSKAIKVEEELFKGNYRSLKDLLFDIQQEKADREIAQELGISYKELTQLDYEVEDGYQSKDGLIYYYIIKFSLESPTEIITKINGIIKRFDGYELEVEPWFFNEKDEDE